MTTKIREGYKTDPKFGRISDGKIRVGIVKNVVDTTYQGRLEVYIPELGGDPDTQSNWIIAMYASPMAGATPVEDNTVDGKTQADSQKAYGWWAVPPHIGNQVLVVFANGESSKCYWFACIYQANMNHMVPGIASDYSHQEGSNGILPPVTEYNKKDTGVNVNSPIRPRFESLHTGLKHQGLYTDFERGPSSTSARRETPSKVFGFLSPNGNTFHIDDDPENEFIRLRTKTGTQVLINDTTGFVYINSKLGNSWLEISDDGINMYSKGNISIRSEQDINIRADDNVNIHAGGNAILKSNSDIIIEGASNIHNLTGGSYYCSATGDMHFTAVNVNTSGSSISQKAGNIARDGHIEDNGGKSKSAASAKQSTSTSHTVVGGTINSPLSIIPGHEPWAGHPKLSSIDPPRGDMNVVEDTTLPVNPNKRRNVTQITGDGKDTTVETPTLSGETVKISPKLSIAKEVMDALRKASTIASIDLLLLIVVCDKESSFRPNIVNPKTGATGLFQFLPSTWVGETCKKYGSTYGFDSSNQCMLNPEKNALAGALYLRDNKKYIESRLNRTITWTEMYLGHFLGHGGCVRFLKAKDANETALISTAVSAKQFAANKPSFEKPNHKEKTIGEVYTDFDNFISSKRKQYTT